MIKSRSTWTQMGRAAIRRIATIVFLSGAVFVTVRLPNTVDASVPHSKPLGAGVEDIAGASILKLGPAVDLGMEGRKVNTGTCDENIMCSHRLGLVPFDKARLVTAFVHDGHGVGQLFAVANSGVSVALASNRSLEIHFSPGHEQAGTLHGASIDDWLIFFGMQQQEGGGQVESLPFQIHRSSTPSIPKEVPGYSGDEEVCDDKLHTAAPSIYVNRTICHMMNPDTACFWRGLFWRNNQQHQILQTAPPLPASDEIHVSVHIRQGDIYKSRIWKRRQMNPEYYKNVLREVLETLEVHFPNHKVHVGVFSNPGPLSSGDMQQFLLSYIPESHIFTKMKSIDDKGEIFKDMKSFISSDIFIGAKSQASLASAFLHRGVSILPKWPPFTYHNGEMHDVLELEPGKLAADLNTSKLVGGIIRRLACRATRP
jgi:hypothetical protein